MKTPERILIIRADKIGDVVLTTPAIALLKKKFPNAHISACVTSKATQEVLQGNPAIAQIFLIEKKWYKIIFQFPKLIYIWKKNKFDTQIIFQGTFWLALTGFFAGIPTRIGPLSKWWSWLLYNQGRRQKRSEAKMHEADYNIELLQKLEVSSEKVRPQIYLQKNAFHSAQEILHYQSINKKFPLIIIHAGMAGSALNWPEAHYVELGKRLIKKFNLVISGGPTESSLVYRIASEITSNQNENQPKLITYIGGDSLSDFLGILNESTAIVVPSTGPMHLATALGKKVVTIFSPIKVQSVTRWGPYTDSTLATALTPEVNCPEHFHCAGSACKYYPCMPSISVDKVEQALYKLIGNTL